MKCSIFRKKVKSRGEWVYRWYYWFYDDKKRRVQVRCKGCKTKAEALQFVRQQNDVNQSTIKNWIEYMFVPKSDYMQYREILNRPCSRITLETYNRISRYIIDDFGDKKLSDLTIKDVVQQLSSVDRANSWKNVYVVVLKEVYKWAAYNGEVVPVPRFPRFHNNAKKSDIFTMQEIRMIFRRENFADPNVYFACKLMLCTGMRSGEALAARKCQFDFDNQFVIIDGFIRAEGRTDYNKKGSNENKRWRVSPLPLGFALELKAFIMGKNIADDDLIFIKQGNRKHDLAWLYWHFQNVLKDVGIEKDGRKLTCHSLRYTYITYSRSMLEGETVRKIAGHNSMEMTEYYTRASVEDACKMLKPIISVVNTFFSQLQQLPEGKEI